MRWFLHFLPAVLANSQPQCSAHWPCCVCLTNVCPRIRHTAGAACETCTSTHLALLTSSRCHCTTADIKPYCNATAWACDVRSNRCVPTIGGQFSNAGDCLASGCGQPLPGPVPPGPPPAPIPGGLWLPNIFANDMVLQAERSSIHGHATPGALVTLTASPPRAGFPAKTMTNSDGIWSVKFGSQVSNLVPSNITVSSGAD